MAFTASWPGVASPGPQTSKLLRADDRGDRCDEGDLAESIFSRRRESLYQLRTQPPQVRAAFLGMQQVGHSLDHIEVRDQGDRVLDVLPSGVTIWVGEDRTRGYGRGRGGLVLQGGGLSCWGTQHGAEAADAEIASVGTMADATSFTVDASRYASDGW